MLPLRCRLLLLAVVGELRLLYIDHKLDCLAFLLQCCLPQCCYVELQALNLSCQASDPV